MKLTPRTLFQRTTVTVALTMFLLIVIALGTTAYFVAIPMAKRSADDFAAVIVAGAESFEQSSGDTRNDVRQHLLQDHGLIVAKQAPALSEKKHGLPYFTYFRTALSRRTGQEVAIIESAGSPVVWVDVPVDDSIVRIGFERKRVGTNPLLVIILAVIGAGLLTLITSHFVVRQVVGPLGRMSNAVREVGHGRNPPTLAEDGPEEVATLARAFNRMSSDMQELLVNRTVIVAGISHDLRTPLTRLGLAVEMLGQESNPELVAGIRRDLAAMEKLIAQFLQFSQGLEEERPEQLDLWQVLEAQVADLRREGCDVNLNGHGPCPFHTDRIALQRVVANLMENAARHGGSAPVDIDLQCYKQTAAITISDRGPGIPADQVEAVFRPFHRLEQARSSNTGGSGLGLAIVRELANKYDWTIELLPREGGGTVAKLGLRAVQPL